MSTEETPSLPTYIRVLRDGDTGRLKVDGVEFPWHISQAGAEVRAPGNDFPRVAVELIAERVEDVDVQAGTCVVHELETGDT